MSNNSSQILDEPEVSEKILVPPKYYVEMLNDDISTFDFVILVLMSVFNKDQEEAYRITQIIHLSGKAIVGNNYDLDSAKTKIRIAGDLAKVHKFPLQCIIKEQS